MLARYLLACLLLVTASPVVANADEIRWRYVTPYERILGLQFSPTEKSGVKLCTSGSWTVENSGFPEVAKHWSVERVPAREIFEVVGSGGCDFAAIRWDKTEDRKKLDGQKSWETVLAKWRYKDIPSLKFKD